MASPRRAVLLTLLAMVLAVLLIDVHGDVGLLLGDLRDTWNDLRGVPTDSSTAP